MFEDNITAQGLYNDLHFLEQYLDNISREVKTPYIDRKGEQIVAHGDCKTIYSDLNLMAC